MSEGGEAAALAILLADPGRTALFTDFDGTLSLIVDDPDEARPLDGATDALADLTATLAKVGVVSGRPAAFLRHHVGVPGVALWGLHGLETVDPASGEVVPMPGVEPWGPVVARAAAEARGAIHLGVVEEKSFALTLHFRRAPGAGPGIKAWAQRCAAETGLVLYPARMSYELRPPVPHGKDVTVAAAAHGLAAACFIGDDAGDAVAFVALDGLGAGAVRVAVNSSEAPAELLARADLVVDGPAGAVAFLQRLAARS